MGLRVRMFTTPSGMGRSENIFTVTHKNLTVSSTGFASNRPAEEYAYWVLERVNRCFEEDQGTDRRFANCWIYYGDADG